MSKIPKRLHWPVLLIGLVAVGAIAVASTRRSRGHMEGKSSATAIRNATTSTNPDRARYVRRGMLSPRLAWHLNALGDRLERPGKERLSIAGTLTRWGELHDVTAVMEFPDRLRLTIRTGLQIRVMTFDGAQARAAGEPLDAAERDVIETLIYGSSEHFFMGQMQGQATRFLGSRFRMDDASAADYRGPFYDVYKVADQIRTSANQREQQKLYYFNSETLLLERVSYEINRNGLAVKVEERIGDWAREQGQQVARRIERFENGEPVFVFTVRTAVLSPRVDDGVF